MGYDARRDELLRELAAIQVPSELAQDHLTQRRLETVEKPAFTKAIEAWGTERRQMFEELVKLIEDPSSTKIQHRAWYDRVQRCMDAYQSSLGGVLSQLGATPTVMANAFATRTSRVEREFLMLLQGARAIGACRDAVAQYRVDVSERTKVLDTVWKQNTATHAEFDKQQQEIYAEISKLLDEAAEKGALEHAARAEKAVGWGAMIIQSMLPTGADDAFRQYVDRLLKQMATLSGRKTFFRELFQREISTTLVTFKYHRDQTEDFVRKHSYEPYITDRAREAKAAFATIVGASPTEGNKRDIEELSKAVTPILDAQVDDVKKIWDGLVQAHQGRFFGGIVQDKVENLLEVKSWRDRGRIMIDKPQNLAQLMQRWHDESRNRFQIESKLDGKLDPAQREQLKQHIDKEMASVIAAMQQFRQELERFISERLDANAREQALDKLLRM